MVFRASVQLPRLVVICFLELSVHIFASFVGSCFRQQYNFVIFYIRLFDCVARAVNFMCTFYIRFATGHEKLLT